MRLRRRSDPTAYNNFVGGVTGGSLAFVLLVGLAICYSTRARRRESIAKADADRRRIKEQNIVRKEGRDLQREEIVLRDMGLNSA